MIPGTQGFFAMRRPKIPIFILALLFISSKNQLSPIKIRITQINSVVQMQIRHAIDKVSRLRRLIIVTVAFKTHMSLSKHVTVDQSATIKQLSLKQS